MNGVQTRLKCKPNVKRCKRFVFAAHSPLLHPNTLKTKAIIHFQTDHILTRFVFPPLKDIPRYGSIGNLQKRIEKAGESHSLSARPYLRTTSDVVSFNASMNYANKRYKETARLIRKNIDNRLATDNDYIILVKAEMALSNTEEVNNRCLAMLDKAQEMAGTSPNLDIYKQKILLLMRMNKQAQATDILKEYIILLSAYEGQGIEGTEKEWTNKEIGWANQMLDRISRI